MKHGKKNSDREAGVEVARGGDTGSPTSVPRGNRSVGALHHVGVEVESVDFVDERARAVRAASLGRSSGRGAHQRPKRCGRDFFSVCPCSSYQCHQTVGVPMQGRRGEGAGDAVPPSAALNVSCIISPI